MNLDEHRQRIRCQTYSIGLSLVAFCIGATGLLGWIFDIELLKKIHPSLVTMKANTAVCLMLAAVSLFLIEGRTASPLRRRISQLLAAVVAIVGLITLSEHVLGWNSGLDQLLFHESRAEAGLSFPGRMGVAASLNFSLLGISLTLLNARARRWFRVANLLVFCVIGITLLVFLYYFYDIERTESFTYYFTIALHTVVAFFCFCAAILLARPERGVITAVLGNSPGAIVARRMWPSLLIVILMGWIVTNRNSGWYSQGLATTMFVLAVLVLLSALIWWTAVSLNRTDRERSVAEGRLGVLARVSELIRTLRDPYELSYAVAETVGTHLKVRRCLFNETDIERDLEIVYKDYCDGVESVAGEHRISDYSSITSREMQLGKLSSITIQRLTRELRLTTNGVMSRPVSVLTLPSLCCAKGVGSRHCGRATTSRESGPKRKWRYYKLPPSAPGPPWKSYARKPNAKDC